MQSNISKQKQPNYIVVFFETVFSRFTSHFSLKPKAAFTKPSRGMSEAKGEQESTETLSFRCDCERCRLTRGAVDISKSKAAFTLAEVLITLGIVGVVAAMTMPALVANYQKKSLATQTQKFYSMMSQAVKQYMADEGVDDLRNTPLTFIRNYDLSDEENWLNDDKAQEACEEFVQKYLKVVEVCENGCFADYYKTQNGEISHDVGVKTENDHSSTGKFALADGAVLDIFGGDIGGPIVIYVDVNGRKGPNKIGYDLWSMSVFYDGSIDEGGLTPECKRDNTECMLDTSSETREWRFEYCKEGGYGGCFGHLLNNNFKFDY